MRFAYAALTLCVLSSALFAADNVFLGTWKLNTERSKFSPGPGPKEMVVKFEQEGNNIHRVATGTDGQGKPINEDSSIPWDGNDHPVTKPPEPPMTVAVTQVNARTVNFVVKRDGKVTENGHAVASKDGKTVTATEDGITDKGQKMHNVEIIEKQ
jgi:hypothetical protein